MSNKAIRGVHRPARQTLSCEMEEVYNQATEHVHVIEDVAGTSGAQSQAQNLYYPELPPNTEI